jgi:hypothetical protein
MTHKEAKYEHRLKNIQAQHEEQLRLRDQRYRENLADLIREGQRIEAQKS